MTRVTISHTFTLFFKFAFFFVQLRTGTLLSRLNLKEKLDFNLTISEAIPVLIFDTCVKDITFREVGLKTTNEKVGGKTMLLSK